MSGVATGIAIAGGIGAAGSIASGAIGASAAQNAASTQANAADQAAQLQASLGQEQLGVEEQQYAQGQANLQPWLQTGANSLATLQYLMGGGAPNGSPRNVSAPITASASTDPTLSGHPTPGVASSNLGTLGATLSPTQGTNQGQTLSIPGVAGSVTLPGVTPVQGTPNTNLGAFGSLMSQYPGGTFQAPTAQQAEQMPGYQFELQQGEQALQQSAAAKGSLLTGGTLNGLDQYAQGLASTDYGNLYNQALNTYNTNYNTWSNQQANEYNRLASLAGAGQTTAQQLNSLGSTTAGQIGTTLGNTGAQIGQQLNNAGAANASGYINSANAINGAVGSGTSSLTQLALMQQLLSGGSSAAMQTPFSTLYAQDQGIY